MRTKVSYICLFLICGMLCGCGMSHQKKNVSEEVTTESYDANTDSMYDIEEELSQLLKSSEFESLSVAEKKEQVESFLQSKEGRGIKKGSIFYDDKHHAFDYEYEYDNGFPTKVVFYDDKPENIK